MDPKLRPLSGSSVPERRKRFGLTNGPQAAVSNNSSSVPETCEGVPKLIPIDDVYAKGVDGWPE